MKLVLIVLLPKPCGGRRPIGLFPTVIRLWMRARSLIPKEWERKNHHPCVYGGPSMGAQRAAWMAAFQAENAALQKDEYLQTLLDIVKAFEKVRHDVLLDAATRHGYCLWTLRMSLAAYRCPRSVGNDGFYSRCIIATCGITAGSGHATIELKCLLLDMVQDGYLLFRSITFTYYVDDVTIETSGCKDYIHARHGAAVGFILQAFRKIHLEVSAAKSGTLGSSRICVEKSVKMDRTAKVKALTRGKMLGVYGAGGRVRCTFGQKERLNDVKGRTNRVHWLRGAGVNTQHLVKTTYVPNALYGNECTGMSDSHLNNTRVTVAKASAPPTRGQSADLMFYAADSAGGRLDPAFEGHAMPIRCWSFSWWQSWHSSEKLCAAHAAATTKLITAKASIWQVVTGPTTATIATAWRIGWTFVAPWSLRTERGRVLDLRCDPPEAVAQEVFRSVRRWRLGRIIVELPGLKPTRTAEIPPLEHHLPPRGYEARARVPEDWHDMPWVLGALLHGRCPKVKSLPAFEASHRCYLNSTVSGRQWPQARLASNKRWELDNTCQLCGTAPGTLVHRHQCPTTRPADGWPAMPQEGTDFISGMGTGAREVLRTRGMAVIRLKISKPWKDEVFEWKLWPDTHADESDITWYIDGSLLDGPRLITSRTGAGFAGVLSCGKLVAYGIGVPPDWITTIPAVEAWALNVILLNTLARRAVVTDCLGNVRAFERGVANATDGKRPLARVWANIFATADDITSNKEHWLVWMPAHTAKASIGVRVKSDGKAITMIDHRANSLVDGLAKAAVEWHRVPAYVRTVLLNAEVAIRHSAALIGVICKAANNHMTITTRSDGTAGAAILRDSMPMKWAARKAERIKAKAAAVERKRKALAELDVKEGKRAKIRYEAAEALQRDYDRRKIVGDQLCENLRRSYDQMEIGSSDEEFWDLDNDMACAGDGLGNSVMDDGIEDSLFDLAGPEFYDLTQHDDTLYDGNIPTETSNDEGMPFEAGSDEDAISLDSDTGPCEFSSVQQSHDLDVNMELLFEKTDNETMTRSQPAEGLAADPGGTGSVVGAEAPYPVIEDAACRKRGSAESGETAVKVARMESYKANTKSRGKAEAQIPGSSSVLTPQQLNSKRQNERRATLRAAEKAVRLSSVPLAEGKGPATTKVKKGAAEESGRLFGAVADFWEAKKRRLHTGLSSERASSSTGA